LAFHRNGWRCAGNAADLVTKLVQQRQSHENHAKLYGEAQRLNATDTNNQYPFTTPNSVTTSPENFAGVLSQVFVDSGERHTSVRRRFACQRR
jgi:hypothetical protein